MSNIISNFIYEIKKLTNNNISTRFLSEIIDNNDKSKYKSVINDDLDNMVNNDLDTSPPNVVEAHNHPEKLYLLVFDLLVFIALFFLAYNSLKNLKLKLGRENDPKMKIANGFIFANGVRALSLIIVILLENNSGDSPTAWINYLAHVIPSMMFLSGYMGLVTVLVEYYYLIKNQKNHLVHLILRVIVVFGYFLIAIIALISFAFQSFKSFAYNSEFVIGVVYIAIGTMFIYYGSKIVIFFKEAYKYEISSIATKVKITTRLVGGLFFIKGFIGLITAFKLFDDVYPTSIGANEWDFINMLLTEIGPNLVFIYVSNKKNNENTPNPDDNKNDIENEKELTNYDGRLSN